MREVTETHGRFKITMTSFLGRRFHSGFGVNKVRNIKEMTLFCTVRNTEVVIDKSLNIFDSALIHRCF